MRHAGEAAALGDASRFRFAVVVARFNAFVTDRLRDAAVAALQEAGAPAGAVDVIAVPGAFEIPQAARAAADTGRYDAIVCLGCLIRGATPHFDYIASAAAHGVTAVSTATGVPCAFGVLTTDTREQALERAGKGPDNKGREAAAAAIEMAALFRAMERPRTGFRA